MAGLGHRSVFPLYDSADQTERFPWTSFVRLSARLIETAKEMEFPPFSQDGRYLGVQYVSEMEKVLGSPNDDSLNAFTARMLLLLESRPCTTEGVYERLLERIIGFYYRDFEDHADDFLPVFLVNDILRFWRTLLRDNSSAASRLVDELTTLYGEFLEQVQRDDEVLLEEFAESGNRKRALEHATRYGDLIYELLDEVTSRERMRFLVI